MSALLMPEEATSKQNDSLISVDDLAFPSHALAGPLFQAKIDGLWKSSVEEANQLNGVPNRAQRLAFAHVDFSGRLAALASVLWNDIDDLKAEAADQINEFRDALLSRVEVTHHPCSETHRGPYVPGGSYTEHFVRFTADEVVTIDLSDIEADCIPLHVEGRYSRTEWDVEVEFDLVEVHPKGDGRGMVAEYRVSVSS